MREIILLIIIYSIVMYLLLIMKYKLEYDKLVLEMSNYDEYMMLGDIMGMD